MLWRYHRQIFLEILYGELERYQNAADEAGQLMFVRFNGTSDIPINRITTLLKDFPAIQWYDYTKDPKRGEQMDRIENYHTTFSVDETNLAHALWEIDEGRTATIVFRTPGQLDVACRRGFCGRPVINGDAYDFRNLDPKVPSGQRGYFVGLYAKGYTARNEETGFVHNYHSLESKEEFITPCRKTVSIRTKKVQSGS